MVQITVNSKTYNSYRIAKILDISDDNKRIGRVTVPYNLSHENTSKIEFFLKDDDSKRKVHTLFIKGSGEQNIPSLLFTSFQVDANFEDTNVSFVGSEIR